MTKLVVGTYVCIVTLSLPAQDGNAGVDHSQAAMGSNASNAVPAAAQLVPSANVGSVTITVGSQPRQTFAGLGASIMEDKNYLLLPPERRAKLNDLLWRDARFNTIRIWLNLRAYAPAPGQRHFELVFADDQATVVRDAQAAGVKHLVLGPHDIPAYLMESLPAKGPDGNGRLIEPYLKTNAFGDHAAIIVDFIRDLWERDHIAVEATGIQNEPSDPNDCVFTPDDVVRSVKVLRAALDAGGFKQVKIIAPESVRCNPPAYAQVAALKADEAAWNDLAGIATHDYGGGATEQMADNIAGTGKEYWQTEFSVSGPEEPGDALRASAAATAFLSDMNHRVNYWVHFIGFLSNSSLDNGTRVIAFNWRVTDDGWIKVFDKYYYLQQLSQTFDVGAVFRQPISSLENDMCWADSPKPRITVAAARNPDGSWGIGISDYTSDTYPRRRRIDGQPPQSFTVTVKVEELAKAGEVHFAARRSSPQSKNISEKPVTMRDGQLTITINPLELVTLRSMSQ